MWGSNFTQNFGSGTDTRVPQNVFLVFLMMHFGVRRAGAFILSPMHVFSDTVSAVEYE